MVDVSGVAGDVFGIAGMGISLGILAHTANNLTRMTDRMYEPRPYSRRQQSRPSYAGRRSMRGRTLERGPSIPPPRRTSTRSPRKRRSMSTSSRSRRRSIAYKPKPRMYTNYWGV